MSSRSWNGSERIERANRSSVWVTQIQGLGRRHRLAKPDQGPRRLHGLDPYGRSTAVCNSNALSNVRLGPPADNDN
jgi:hypothetical protein